MIRRLDDPNDRRGRLVELTPKGRRLVDKAIVEHLTDEERLLAVLRPAERRRLAKLLRKLLLSERFRALDPAHLVETAAPVGRRRRTARLAG